MHTAEMYGYDVETFQRCTVLVWCIQLQDVWVWCQEEIFCIERKKEGNQEKRMKKGRIYKVKKQRAGHLNCYEQHPSRAVEAFQRCLLWLNGTFLLTGLMGWSELMAASSARMKWTVKGPRAKVQARGRILCPRPRPQKPVLSLGGWTQTTETSLIPGGRAQTLKPFWRQGLLLAAMCLMRCALAKTRCLCSEDRGQRRKRSGGIFPMRLGIFGDGLGVKRPWTTVFRHFEEDLKTSQAWSSKHIKFRATVRVFWKIHTRNSDENYKSASWVLTATHNAARRLRSGSATQEVLRPRREYSLRYSQRYSSMLKYADWCHGFTHARTRASHFSTEISRSPCANSFLHNSLFARVSHFELCILETKRFWRYFPLSWVSIQIVRVWLSGGCFGQSRMFCLVQRWMRCLNHPSQESRASFPHSDQKRTKMMTILLNNEWFFSLP